jgi:indole-3-glycerol phosphate synthase
VSTILDKIVDYKRTVEVPKRIEALPLAVMEKCAAAGPPPRDFIAALRAVSGVALIAEVKRASPSRGVLRQDFNPLHLADIYADHGAAAISVLTDPRFFHGDMAHLTAIRAHLDNRYESVRQFDGSAIGDQNSSPPARRPPPLLRKDFVIHPYQVYEARAAGADAVLLIAAVLDNAELAELMALTSQLGMAALVEVHTATELSRVLPLAPRLVGINNRDLRDFRVRLETCLELRAAIPPEVCCVAESGIQSVDDVARLRAAGFDAMLVGEALLTAADIAARVRELTRGQS